MTSMYLPNMTVMSNVLYFLILRISDMIHISDHIIYNNISQYNIQLLNFRVLYNK